MYVLQLLTVAALSPLPMEEWSSPVPSLDHRPTTAAIHYSLWLDLRLGYAWRMGNGLLMHQLVNVSAKLKISSSGFTFIIKCMHILLLELHVLR